MDFFSRYNPPPAVNSDTVGPSETLQDAADECDINKMIARYQKSGSFHGSTNVPSQRPQFGDFTDVGSYQAALNTVLEAQEQFAGLPASIRSYFGNDAAAMLAFLENTGNYEEAVKLGLVNPKPVSDASGDAKE